MLISHSDPFVVASIGRNARYISSGTPDASSIINSDSPENPRTVFCLGGNPTIRDLFGSFRLIRFFPSPRARIPIRSNNSPALPTNSAACRSLAEANTIRIPGSVYAR